jgi:hypothetical protein
MDRKDDPPPEIVKSGIIGDPETLREQGLGRPFLSIGLYGNFRCWPEPETLACSVGRRLSQEAVRPPNAKNKAIVN